MGLEGLEEAEDQEEQEVQGEEMVVLVRLVVQVEVFYILPAQQLPIAVLSGPVEITQAILRPEPRVLTLAQLILQLVVVGLEGLEVVVGLECRYLFNPTR